MEILNPFSSSPILGGYLFTVLVASSDTQKFLILMQIRFQLYTFAGRYPVSQHRLFLRLSFFYWMVLAPLKMCFTYMQN